MPNQYIISVKGSVKCVQLFIQQNGNSRITLPTFLEDGSCQVEFLTTGTNRSEVSAAYLQILSRMDLPEEPAGPQGSPLPALEISIRESLEVTQYSSLPVY